MVEASEKELQRRVNQALDRELENLDELTAAKLKRARLNALAHRPAQKPWWQSFGLPQGLAASGVSLALVFALVKPFTPADAGLSPTELQLMAVMNPVLSEEPEMLQELEFIAWLEQEGGLESGI